MSLKYLVVPGRKEVLFFKKRTKEKGKETKTDVKKI